MNIKIVALVAFLSFSSCAQANISYEVRGTERVSDMFGEAVCVSLYIENNSRKDYQFNLFAIEGKGDGLSSTPSVFTTKEPGFNVNGSLSANSKARGWLRFDEPEYGWVPETIAFSEVWGSTFLTVKVK